MTTIGERFKEVRKFLRLNQEKFAKELGISQNHVSAIEKGKYTPSLPLIKLISLKFNISEQWLIDGSKGMVPDFDLITDEGIKSKYNEMRVLLERTLESRSGESLKHTVEAYSCLLSLVSTNGIQEENKEAYLKYLYEVISNLEFLEYKTYLLKNFGRKKNYQALLAYKDYAQEKLNLIESNIRGMINVILEQYDAQVHI